jgi:hypothetical protein
VDRLATDGGGGMSAEYDRNGIRRLSVIDGQKDTGPSHAATLRDLAVTNYVKKSWAYVCHPNESNRKSAREAMRQLQDVLHETAGQR